MSKKKPRRGDHKTRVKTPATHKEVYVEKERKSRAGIVYKFYKKIIQPLTPSKE